MSDTLPDGRPWPKISIVTPSYNQGQFLEETIRSVLLQGYPDLEYIIMDGGSNDGSTEIIKKYEKWLTYWVSQPDEGQADAINRGFLKSRGEILAWLNSDDTYLLGVLKTIGEFLHNNPSVDVVYGNTNFIDSHSNVLRRYLDVPFTKRRLIYGALALSQPATFFRRAVFMNTGMLREEFFFTLDAELWLRMCLKGARFCHLRKTLANFRFHQESKTSRYQKVCREETRRFRRELLNQNDQSLPFQILQWLYPRLWRPALLIRQGDVKYVWEGIARRFQSILG